MGSLSLFIIDSFNRGIKSIEGKKTPVQCPLGRKLYKVKIALEMESVYNRNVVFYFIPLLSRYRKIE